MISVAIYIGLLSNADNSQNTLTSSANSAVVGNDGAVGNSADGDVAEFGLLKEIEPDINDYQPGKDYISFGVSLYWANTNALAGGALGLFDNDHKRWIAQYSNAVKKSGSYYAVENSTTDPKGLNNYNTRYSCAFYENFIQRRGTPLPPTRTITGLGRKTQVFIYKPNENSVICTFTNTKSASPDNKKQG
ncbi:MAG: hypothetical protein IPG12_11085 [Saprospiraceae bacterium]|nr:hypothetical protein [Saprospiraceae bacterium]